MDVVARAQADLAKLDEVIRRAQDTLDRARRDRDEIATFLRVHERYAAGASAPAPSSSALMSKTDAVRGHVRDILLRHNRRMTISELHDSLTAMGVHIGGQQPKPNLAGMLSRDEAQFNYEKPAGWWLTGVPEPSGPVVTSDENEGVADAAPSDAEAPAGSLPAGASDSNPPLLSFPARTAA